VKADLRPALIRWPADGAPGELVLEAVWRRAGTDVLLRVVARTDAEGGRAILLRGRQAPHRQWYGHLVEAHLRWGNDHLALVWPGSPSDPVAAVVSDPMLLATDRTAQWAVRALFDAVAALGRPPGLTTITNDDEILTPLRAMRADGRRITQPTLAAFSGRFTVDELRGYLRVNGKRWRDILDT
jgi:hypothetical protein